MRTCLVLERDQLVGFDAGINMRNSLFLMEATLNSCLDSMTGRLLFEYAPDFGRPLGANQNNVYGVGVSAVSDDEAVVKIFLFGIVDVF